MKPNEIAEDIDFDHPRLAGIVIYFITGAITVKIVWNHIWPAVVSAGIVALAWYTWPASKTFILVILALYAIAVVAILLVVAIGYVVPSDFIKQNWGEQDG